jgi:hypothetical protein
LFKILCVLLAPLARAALVFPDSSQTPPSASLIRNPRFLGRHIFWLRVSVRGRSPKRAIAVRIKGDRCAEAILVEVTLKLANFGNCA